MQLLAVPLSLTSGSDKNFNLSELENLAVCEGSACAEGPAPVSTGWRLQLVAPWHVARH